MNDILEEKWISLEEAATYLGISPVTLRDWIKKQDSNCIPCQKIGKQWKFKKTELDQWIKSGKSAF